MIFNNMIAGLGLMTTYAGTYYGDYGNRYAYRFDWTIILVLIGVAISLWASFNVNSAFRKYAQVASQRGMTGAQVADHILQSNGITNVKISAAAGQLTDHFDPRTNVVNLSESVYGQSSIAAVSVAAHECGHAIQHAQNYAPLKIRTAIVPVANIGSYISWPLIILGLVMGAGGNIFLTAGIILFSAVVLFQIVTLPVEFDASRRALKALESSYILTGEENKHAKKVLRAAALTYVAGAAAAILQLLRIILISRRR